MSPRPLEYLTFQHDHSINSPTPTATTNTFIEKQAKMRQAKRAALVDSNGSWKLGPDKSQVDGIFSFPNAVESEGLGERMRGIVPDQDDGLSSSSAMGDSPNEAAIFSLFVFWEPRELVVLLPAALAALLVAGAKVLFAVVLGMIFQETANLGSGVITADEGLSRVAVLSLALSGVGLLKAVSAAFFMAHWILHGESRARTARRRLFQSLLRKPMSWFDSRREGTASILIRLQT